MYAGKKECLIGCVCYNLFEIVGYDLDWYW